MSAAEVSPLDVTTRGQAGKNIVGGQKSETVSIKESVSSDDHLLNRKVEK